MGSSRRGKSILSLLGSWGVCGRPGGRADTVFHIVLWLPIFLFETRTLHCGRCEGKQFDEGLGFFSVCPLKASRRLLPPCQCFHWCDLYLLPLPCCSPTKPVPMARSLLVQPAGAEDALLPGWQCPGRPGEMGVSYGGLKCQKYSLGISFRSFSEI